ncbi:BaiN/RdsA family NAD(P)/FAD-dependent oxidoreductase [Pectinatus sottacetonis]|uniref:NAD(P)/FAD-dependent oxidoreductase n=1 Tax=Pectinatus sottacetonis TaxID=1002795 RepID=UPI0018C6FFC1|nr:NAD(P)/FAD-dependent oxidoreductase [Pectinatus sottacetonis]
MKKILVIGAGAAGIMAAIEAAKTAEVTLVEQKDKIGRKLMITGKGRCNITNTADLTTFIKNIPGNGKFLYSAFKNFFNDDVVKFFTTIGVKTKVERGGRVFPKSDSAFDVVNGLKNKLYDSNISLLLNTRVARLILKDNCVTGIETWAGKIILADAVILCAGGASYPLTGSDGSGIKLAQEVGHTITPLTPALVPLESDAPWIKGIQGLSLRNVKLSVFTNNKKSDELFGEMMFTHFGVTGPIILSASRAIALNMNKGKKVYLSVNLKPALNSHQVDLRIQRDFEKYKHKQVKNAMTDLLPHKLIPIILDLSYIDAEKSVSEVTKKERRQLAVILQNLSFDITKTRPLAEAIVTCGGIRVKEINPQTMQSKLVKNLYFAGEVLDIDGYTGGFNLQAAFSMGYTAGQMAVR